MNPTMQQNTNDRCKLNVDPSKYGIKFKPLIQLTEETMKYVENSWHHATLTKELLIPEEDWRYTEEDYEFEDMLNIIKTYGVKPPKTHNLFWYNSQLQIDCFSNDDELLKFAIKMSKGNNDNDNDNETSELDDNLSTDVESTSDEYENDDIDGSSEYDEETDKIELKIKKTENQENTESKSSNVTGNEIFDFIIKTVMGNYFCNVNYDENNIVNENENEI